MTRGAPLIRVDGAPTRAVVGLGVPLPRGWLDEAIGVRLLDRSTGAAVPTQSRVLRRWPDRSVRWLLVDTRIEPGEGAALELATVNESGPADAAAPVRATVRADETVEIVDAARRFVVGGQGQSTLCELFDRGEPAWSARLVLHGAWHMRTEAHVGSVRVLDDGPVRTTVEVSGRFRSGCPLEFTARVGILHGVDGVRIQVRVRNPRAAVHRGGLWDLGDPGSWRFEDVSVEVTPSFRPDAIEHRIVPSGPVARLEPSPWTVYQDSSGGERWDSPVHVEADGCPGASFRGFAVRGTDGATAGAGLTRAQPTLAAVRGSGRVAVTIRDFWQNFPKALRWNARVLSASLFPREHGRPFELQGGEQKRHDVFVTWGEDAFAAATTLADPPHAWVDPYWIEATGAVPGLVVDLADSPVWNDYVRRIVEGPAAFVERREHVDEYGWRHFGDLWADHEAVNHTGPEPFVSHYNNQYDFVLAAGVHALRTGDPRWSRLAREAAEHTTDIDLYHTDEDRAAFNGGLFWHTDHYVPARTSTHRTYSVGNAESGDYGGGPSNEHNYASGLLLHYWRTGDPDALEGVIGLADWVVAMDDGTRTVFGAIDAGSTGLASRTVVPGYHGPGRGAGNSINVLLDGYAATGARHYLEYADTLVRRCVHPREDIARHGLDDIEHRWSYLVFLQAMGRFLEAKLELDEIDFPFHYARECLLNYAEWMLDHEAPYYDRLDRVELPTETWVAQDVRKTHVFHLAARFDDRGRAARYAAEADRYRTRMVGDLGRFTTRFLTRPLVLLAVFGHLHEYHLRLAPVPEETRRRWRHDHCFGECVEYLSQRTRLRATALARWRTSRAELARIVRATPFEPKRWLAGGVRRRGVR